MTVRAKAATHSVLKPVDTQPEINVQPPKANVGEMVMINIDREQCDGGIMINGKLYVGNVKVTEAQAEDLLRIQSEYFETKKKMLDKNVIVRMKSDFQKERLFLADPKEHEMKKSFSRDYGLLPAKEWSYCSPKFKEKLLRMRKQMYGY